MQYFWADFRLKIFKYFALISFRFVSLLSICLYLIFVFSLKTVYRKMKTTSYCHRHQHDSKMTGTMLFRMTLRLAQSIPFLFGFVSLLPFCVILRISFELYVVLINAILTPPMFHWSFLCFGFESLLIWFLLKKKGTTKTFKSRRNTLARQERQKGKQSMLTYPKSLKKKITKLL